MNRETHQTLEYVWTVSKGRETYGYNICSLYANGNKVSSCNGGGYDMQGVALASYLNDLGITVSNGAVGRDYIIMEANKSGKVKITSLYLPKAETTVYELELLDENN